MKYFWILTLILFAGCTETEEPELPEDFVPDVENVDPFEGLSKVETIELHIRRELTISPDEPTMQSNREMWLKKPLSDTWVITTT